jgi:hypothetical protein
MKLLVIWSKQCGTKNNTCPSRLVLTTNWQKQWHTALSDEFTNFWEIEHKPWLISLKVYVSLKPWAEEMKKLAYGTVSG